MRLAARALPHRQQTLPHLDRARPVLAVPLDDRQVGQRHLEHRGTFVGIRPQCREHFAQARGCRVELP